MVPVSSDADGELAGDGVAVGEGTVDGLRVVAAADVAAVTGGATGVAVAAATVAVGGGVMAPGMAVGGGEPAQPASSIRLRPMDVTLRIISAPRLAVRRTYHRVGVLTDTWGSQVPDLFHLRHPAAARVAGNERWNKASLESPRLIECGRTVATR